MNVHLFLEGRPTRQEQKIITLSKYVQNYPQGWKKRLELADLLYEMGNWQEAVAEYRQVIERQPQLLGVRLQLGKLLQIMGLEKEAIEVYEKALSCSDNEGTQNHIKGLIAVCRGESEKAIIAFNLAASLEPEKVVHWLALAQVHQHRENPLGVLSSLKQVLAINPDDVVALIYSHDALMAVGNIPAARACFQTSPPDSDPPQPPIPPPTAPPFLRGARGENSVKVPREVKGEASSDPPLFKGGEGGISLGDLGGSASLKTDPRGQLSKAIALIPHDFRVLQRQIEQRLQMRLVSGIEGKLTKKMITSLLLQNPHGAEAHKSLAYYHILRGDWAQGVEVLAEFTAEHPHYPFGWYYYGQCLFDTGEYQRAAQMMAKAYQLYPDNCAIYQGLCEILPFVIPNLQSTDTHTDPPKSPKEIPPSPPLKRGGSEDALPFTSRGTLNSTPVPPVKKGTLNSTPVPPFLRGARGDQPTVARINEIGMTSPLPPLLKGEGNVVEEMLKRFPERWSVWATAGRVLVEHFKEIERGCSVSFQGTKLQPQLADAWFRHGRVLALAGKHRGAVEALEKGWELLPAGGYLQSVPAAVWLAESFRVLGDVGASKRWWQAAGEGCQELREFNPAMADYWLGRVLVGLGDKLGAIQAYESALSQQLLYPARGEVEKNLQRLKGKGRKGSRG
jgi:tetratricopeptide (TPR) repeat protein